MRQFTELAARIIQSAIRWDAKQAQQIAETAKKAKVNCVIGINELSDQPGSRTVCTPLLIVISRKGEIVARHRKLMPTHSERAYWGMGGASDIEKIHCSLWPGWWKLDGHLGAKSAEPGGNTCDIESAVRQHAIENQVFVVSCSWYGKESDMPAELKGYMKYNLAVGGSCIVNPSGIIIEGPVFNKECIVHKEIDLAERDLAKAYFDCLGHYSRPDILSCVFQ